MARHKTIVSTYVEGTNDFGLENINLSGLADAELTRLQTDLGEMSNPELTIDVFSKIKYNFAPNMLVYSADTSKPAVDTGGKFSSNYSGGLNTVPIEIYIPKTTQIIGAGGKGANVTSVRNYPELPADHQNREECPVAFTVQSAQKSTLSGAHVKYCSLPELSSAGVGPISRKYLDGKMDGSYIVGLAPNNGADGGTALSIHSDYAGSSVKIDCRGFIGGGGGGGGPGGTRVSNITSLQIPKVISTYDPVSNTINLKKNYGLVNGVSTWTAAAMYPYMRDTKYSSFTNAGRTHDQPSLQNKFLGVSTAMAEGLNTEGSEGTFVDDTIVFEARPGGGGGGGAGYARTARDVDYGNVTFFIIPPRAGKIVALFYRK